MITIEELNKITLILSIFLFLIGFYVCYFIYYENKTFSNLKKFKEKHKFDKKSFQQNQIFF